ncbi:MAG: VWA domain-containing protein [Nannocystaceae bacterium]
MMSLCAAAFSMWLPEAPRSVGFYEDAIFAHTHYWWTLLSLPVVIVAVAWGSRQRRRAMAALGDAHLVRRLTDTVSNTRRVLTTVFVALAMFLTCVGLLRMQYGGVAEIVPTRGLDIVVAVDYSKSMLAQDVYPSRSERLEAELTRFFEDAERRGDRVGLVVFAGAPRGLPLTKDTRIPRLYLQRADPRSEEPGGTALGPALQLALTFLSEARIEAGTSESGAEADQVIILLTDGEDTGSRPLEMATEAAKLGVRIYTVGIGSRVGEPIQKFDAQGAPDGYQVDEEGDVVMTRLDEETLKAIAKTTDGAYVHVGSENFGLDEVRGLMAGLTRAQREETVQIHREEGFPLFVLPAFIILTIGLSIPLRRRLAA